MAKKKEVNGTVIAVSEPEVNDTVNEASEINNVVETTSEPCNASSVAQVGMTEAKNKAIELAKKWSEAALFGEGANKKKIKKDIDEAIEDYAKYAELQCFNEILKADDPLYQAAVVYHYEVIRAKVSEDDEENEVMEIETAYRAIDPLRLHKKNAKNGGVGHDSMWQYMVESLNFLLTANKAIDLGINPKEVSSSYKMNEKAKEVTGFKLSADGTAQFKEALVDDMKKVITAMVGEKVAEKVSVYDANWLMSIYSKKVNKSMLTVSVSNHKYLRQYMLEICHKLITGKCYSLEYKKASGK